MRPDTSSPEADGAIDRTLTIRILTIVLFAEALESLVFYGDIALAAVLVLVAVKLNSDRMWLLVPIIVNGVGLLSVLGRTIAVPPGEGPPLTRPFLTTGLPLVVYVVGYRFLGAPGTNEEPSRGWGMRWRFDQWSGGRG